MTISDEELERLADEIFNETTNNGKNIPANSNTDSMKRFISEFVSACNNITDHDYDADMKKEHVDSMVLMLSQFELNGNTKGKIQELFSKLGIDLSEIEKISTSDLTPNDFSTAKHRKYVDENVKGIKELLSKFRDSEPTVKSRGKFTASFLQAVKDVRKDKATDNANPEPKPDKGGLKKR
jgi:hypothetical protein